MISAGTNTTTTTDIDNTDNTNTDDSIIEEINEAAIDRCDDMMNQSKEALQLTVQLAFTKSCVKLLLQPISLKCVLF